jgi:hypothetical protein
MFERFTGPARTAVVRSQDEARAMRSPRIGTEHLLIALAAPDAGVSSTVLTEWALDQDRLRELIRAIVPARPGDPAAGPVLPGVNDEDAAALRTLGIDIAEVRASIERALGPDFSQRLDADQRRGLFGRRRGSGGGHIPFAPRAKKVLELSLREALRLKHNYIGTEHILLGIVRDGGGVACEVLVGVGVDLEEVRRATLSWAGQAA